MTRMIIFFSCSVAMLYATIYILFTVPMHGTRIYDCSIAEIHPDYPLEVKQECRKLNVQKNKGVST